jgi:hypothetical protein
MNQEQAKAASARLLLAAGVFGLALGGLVPVFSFTSAAFAQEEGGHEDGGHEDGGHEDGGHEDGGHEDGGHEDGGHEGGGGKGGQGNGGQGDGKGGKGQGQGGPGEDSDGQGPKAGSGGSEGGKPVWAQEGIPEVELGRLNVARSPDQVLERALDEAIASLTPEMIAYYNLSLNDAVLQLTRNFDLVSFIDSPLQNLALLENVLSGGTAMKEAGVNTEGSVLAAKLLGAASDKTVPISTNTVIAITAILGTPISLEAAKDLAERAEEIRIAILAGHG